MMKFRILSKANIILIILISIFATGLLIINQKNPKTHSIASSTESLNYESTGDDKLLLEEIRNILVSGDKELINTKRLKILFENSSFPKNAHGVGIIYYQPGNNRIAIIRNRKSSYYSLLKVLKRSLIHPRYKDFDFADPDKSRIQIDFIKHKPISVKLSELNPMLLDSNRFEIGITGLHLKSDKNGRYFFPGDAYVKSIMYGWQLRKYINKLFDDTPLSKIEASRFESESYISYKSEWIRLYRGYPVVGDANKEYLEKIIEASTSYVIKKQRPDGRFMYYYDAHKDSYKDHKHPKRNPDENPYYNILRHSGGGILLLYHYKYYKDSKVLPAIKEAIEYLIDQIQIYELPNGQKAGYVFYNKKSKLGGSGIALYFLSEYQHLTGDNSYENWARLLNNHLLNQITDSGEFMYYNIYLNKEVTEEDNQKYFSFFYPGEAIIGMATYYKYILKDKDIESLMQKKLHSALHFLYVIRPKTHANQYMALPSDAWLMMAVNEIWDIPEMRDNLYKKKVFKDADQMIDHMYKPDNALYPDYVGAYYYHYGNFPYADGARDEGLLAAYELAIKTNDAERIKKYESAIKLAIWSTVHLVNTPESSYAVPNPEMTIGGVRFKHTRQWLKIDTIQHVIGFHIKFLKYLE